MNGAAALTIFLLAVLAPGTLCGDEPAPPPTPAEVARQVFLSAAESHRALRECKLAFSTNVEVSVHYNIAFDATTTGTVERRWRHECLGDYKLGALVSETYRLSEKFNGVEEVDFPRPVLAHRLSPDAQPRAIRQAVPRLDPRWSTIEPQLVDDSRLFDAIDSMDRVAGKPTAEFLDEWRGMYIDNPELRATTPITIAHSHDGSIIEVVIECRPPLLATYKFHFSRDEVGLRFDSLRYSAGTMSTFKGTYEYEVDWAVMTGPEGEVVRLPIRNLDVSEMQHGPRMLEMHAPGWTIARPAADTRELEAFVAERSALIMYEGMQHRLEVERRRREEDAAPAPSP